VFNGNETEHKIIKLLYKTARGWIKNKQHFNAVSHCRKPWELSPVYYIINIDGKKIKIYVTVNNLLNHDIIPITE